MRLLFFLFAAVGSGLAQEAPIGIIRGDLLAWSGTAAEGELVFRNAENQVYQCSFDTRTYFERSNERISVAAMTRGEHVEVLSDRKPGTGICYARTVEVLDTAPPKMAVQKRSPHAPVYRSATDFIAPRGDMTFAGVVLKVSDSEILLRMRTNERKIILLRSDTRYLSDGQSLERSHLLVNTRVFVRAGRNLDDRVEAYQVVWADILEPVVKPRVIP